VTLEAGYDNRPRICARFGRTPADLPVPPTTLWRPTSLGWLDLVMRPRVLPCSDICGRTESYDP